jgi:hypothetical protein
MSNSTQALTSKEYLKSLQILHKALLAGVILFSFVTIFLINKTGFAPKVNESFKTIGFVLVPLAAVIGLISSTFIFKKQVDKILLNTSMKLVNKLELYRAASIARWAFLEAPMLLATIFLFLTGSYYFIAVSFIILIFYIMYTPSVAQISNHLQLSSNEQMILEDEYGELR